MRRQVRESRFDKRAIILPLVIVAVDQPSLHRGVEHGPPSRHVADCGEQWLPSRVLGQVASRARALGRHHGGSRAQARLPSALGVLALRCPRQGAVRFENANPGDVVQRERLQAPGGGVDAAHHAATQ